MLTVAKDKIADAVESKDWQRARFLATLKVAKAMDNTESSREIKALSLSLVELISECEKASEQESKPQAKMVAFTTSAKFAKAAND